MRSSAKNITAKRPQDSYYYDYDDKSWLDSAAFKEYTTLVLRAIKKLKKPNTADIKRHLVDMDHTKLADALSTLMAYSEIDEIQSGSFCRYVVKKKRVVEPIPYQNTLGLFRQTDKTTPLPCVFKKGRVESI